MKITDLRRHVTVGPGGDHADGPATGRVRAVWEGAVLAESDRTIVIEGNHYFPVRDVAFELLAPSDARSTCPWKGEGELPRRRHQGRAQPGSRRRPCALNRHGLDRGLDSHHRPRRFR